MRKIYSLLVAILFSIGIVSAQCTPDTSTTFFSPKPDSLPCIDSSLAYSQVVHIFVWDSLNMETVAPNLITQTWWIYIDSLNVDSLTKFPTGITGQFNPANGHLYPHTHDCLLISGTTNDTSGSYNLEFWGKIYFHSNGYGNFWPAGDTSLPLTLFHSSASSPLSAILDVVRADSSCRTVTGINNFSADLNASLSVYPNPNSGKFDLQINAGRRVNGEILVMDITGRTVYTQRLDVIGLYNNSIDLGKCARGIYTLQLRTPEGYTSKKISIE